MRQLQQEQSGSAAARCAAILVAVIDDGRDTLSTACSAIFQASSLRTMALESWGRHFFGKRE